MAPRTYTLREEIMHSASHGGGVLASIAALVWLVIVAAKHGDARRVIGGALFGTAAVLLFAASTLYHGARQPDLKRTLRKLDHCAIYVLIAATYSAFTLSVMRDRTGWALFAAVWALTVFGIGAELLHRESKPLGAVVLYITMGWIGLLAIRELITNLTGAQLAWVLAGGLCYTAGVPFYVAKSRPYAHAWWHLFVLGGVACHFIAVLGVMRVS